MDATITERMRRYRARIKKGLVAVKRAPRVPARYRADLERDISLRAVRLDRDATRLRTASKRKRGEERDALLAEANDAAAMASWWRLVLAAAKGDIGEGQAREDV
jgi:hypothetical protein